MTYPILTETVASISELKVIAAGKRDRNEIYEIALSRLIDRQ
ncbi:MAG: hypothetical protein WCK96_06140 [Methylococcales bacterium]